MYNSANLNFKNDSIRKQFAECVVERLKNKLPNGLGGIQADSLNNLANDIGISYKK